MSLFYHECRYFITDIVIFDAKAGGLYATVCSTQSRMNDGKIEIVTLLKVRINSCRAYQEEETSLEIRKFFYIARKEANLKRRERQQQFMHMQ